MKYSQRGFAKASGVERTKLQRLVAAGKLIPEHDDAGKTFYTAEQIPLARQLAGIDDASQPLFDDEPPAQDVEAVVTTETIPPADNAPAPDDAAPVEVVPAADDAPAADVAESVDVVPVTLADRAEKIRRLQVDVQRGIIDIGFELIAARAQVSHGQWAQWLERELDFTPRVAQYFMAVAQRFGNANTYSHLKASTLRVMLSLPVGTEQDFIDDQAAAGRPVERQSAREVKRNVAQFKRDHTADTTETSEEIQGGQIFNVFGKEPPAQDTAPDVETAATEPTPDNEPATDTPSPAAAAQDVAPETGNLTFAGVLAAARRFIDTTNDPAALNALHRKLLSLADPTALDALRRELLTLADTCAAKIERSDNL